jgi:hypothetical protein
MLAHLEFRNACGRLAVNPPLTRKAKQNETMTHTHTPGPWDQIGCDIYSGEIKIARFIDIPWERMLENEANINLISAAPDLLAALEDAEFLLRKAGLMAGPMRDSFNRSASDARAAIAKATGKGDA